MHRFKIGIATALLLLVSLGILSLGRQPETQTESLTKRTSPSQSENKIDPEQAKIYRLRQERVRVQIRDYFTKALAAKHIVGAGVSIVQGDSILLLEGFGKRNVMESTSSIDGQTLFRLGSLSKGFAGVLATDLREEGKIDWDDTVRSYLPEFQLGDSVNTEKITLAHILSHTSGTPYHSFTNLVEAGLPLSTIAKRFKEVAPISDPGAMYSYQNAMFALCGEIMEQVTGQDIATLLTTRFFTPLGMKGTTTDYHTLINSTNVALPHTRRGKGWVPRKLSNSYHNAIAAGGINASSEDMAKWMRFLLGHNPQVMESSELAQAFAPRVEVNIGRKYYKRWPGHVASHYGFGWRNHTFEDENTGARETVWHHGGSVNHFRNEIALYPQADLGICVLINGPSKLAGTVIPDLRAIVRKVYEKTAATSTDTLPQSTAALSFEE
ncbi:MAG: serine hydrolase domain-containing protein [Bacteroidota bacterium]